MGNKNSGLKNFTIPFDLEQEESRYWLGYICADGNIQYSKKHRIYKTSLASKDYDIIQKFIEFIGTRCHYHFQKSNNIHIAYINSRQLCEYLINYLNIIPKKSLILNPFIIIDKDFLRGYFDGDGNIRIDRKISKITTGSKIFATRIIKYLNQNNIYNKLRKYDNAYYIEIERVKETQKFLNLLYNNSKIFLNRKFNSYVALCSNT